MKFRLVMILLLFTGNILHAQEKVNATFYTLPDSINAVQFMAEVKIGAITGKREIYTGIQTDLVKVFFEADKHERVIEFKFPENAPVLASGEKTEIKSHAVKMEYEWEANETYKMIIATATDSAENFSLFSGYVFLPKEKKWKLLGTCRIEGRSNSLIGLSTFSSESGIQANYTQVAIQRNSGSWKDLLTQQNMTAPTIAWFGHTDSLYQAQKDVRQIEDSIRNHRTDAIKNEQGVYYAIMKEGSGRQVSVNDTVIAYYKGYTFTDGKVFDQTKDKPATFPLKRLIKGWQVGVPLVKVGGKIKLIIPSGLAYSIRTRASKIPPNNILVFEIEVVDVKPQ